MDRHIARDRQSTHVTQIVNTMISYSHELHISGNVGEGVGWKRNQHIYTLHHSTLSSLFISPHPYFLRIIICLFSSLLY